MAQKFLAGLLALFAMITIAGCTTYDYVAQHPYYTRGDVPLTQDEVVRQDQVVGHCAQVVNATLPTRGEVFWKGVANGALAGGIGGVIGQTGTLALQGAALTAGNIAVGGLWTAPVYGVASGLNKVDGREYIAFNQGQYCHVLDQYNINTWLRQEAQPGVARPRNLGNGYPPVAPPAPPP